MSQLDKKVISELVFDPILLFSFLPLDGLPCLKPIVFGKDGIPTVFGDISPKSYDSNGLVRVGHIRKVSRFLSSRFKLARMERYAEQVKFQLKDGYIFARSRHTNVVLNCIELPLGECVLPYQMKVFIQVYFNYKLYYGPRIVGSQSFVKIKTGIFEERDAVDVLQGGMDLQQVLILALSFKEGKFIF